MAKRKKKKPPFIEENPPAEGILENSEGTIVTTKERYSKLQALMDNPDNYKRLLFYITQGAWDYQAAEACGVTKTTYYAWMNRGKKESATGRFRQFYQDVIQARAAVRIKCEITVAAEDPLYWLTKGPGRAAEGEPGWSDTPIASQEPKDLAALQAQGDKTVTDLADVLKVFQSCGILDSLVASVKQDVEAEETSNQTLSSKEGHYPLANVSYEDLLAQSKQNGNGNGRPPSS